MTNRRKVKGRGGLHHERKFSTPRLFYQGSAAKATRGEKAPTGWEEIPLPGSDPDYAAKSKPTRSD